MGSEAPGEDIEVRTCGKCGEEFYGLTRSSAHQKMQEHEKTCSPKPEYHSEDAAYRTTIQPPKDPTEYEQSPHFHSMKVRREDPEITSDIIESTIQLGHIKNTSSHDRFIFEWHDGDWKWWLVVQIRDEALRKSDEKHIALTVFAKNSPSHSEVEKYL